MARKRLLMILAGAVAVIGLQAGPATALDAEVDLVATEVDASLSEDGAEAGLGEDDQVEVEVSEDGVDAEAGDEEVSTQDPADEVEDAAEEVAEDTEVSDGKTSDDDEQESSSTRTSRSRSSGGEVTTAGDARGVERRPDRPDPLDAEQARRFLPGSDDGIEVPDGRRRATGSFDLSPHEDPLVAAPSERSDDGPADWESVSPTPDRSDAELAAIPGDGADGGAVPAGLRLLAGLLVAGTATVWHLTRRELATTPTRTA